MDNLLWLQDWYSSRCNGDWEHQQGISIQTLDNPGWDVKIELIGTEQENIPFQTIERKGDEDWITCKVKDNQFLGIGGKKNLDEILQIFRTWTRTNGKTIQTND